MRYVILFCHGGHAEKNNNNNSLFMAATQHKKSNKFISINILLMITVWLIIGICRKFSSKTIAQKITTSS